MKTPESYLKTIVNLRIQHTQNANKGQWWANDRIREKIKLAWVGYHAAKENPRFVRPALGKPL